jgi:predicted dehydrogenase
MKPLSLAIIGAGTHARTILIPTIALVDEVRLAALATSRVDTARAAEERYGVPASADWRAIIARADVEAVVVSTQPDRHEQIACAALEAGKHVLVESPVCSDAAAARRVQGVADRCGLVAQAAYMLRSGAAIEVLAERLRALPPPRLFLYEYFAFAHHIFDLSLHLSGPLESVLCTTQDAAGKSATLRFRNGDTAVVVGRALANCSIDIERITVSGPDFYAAVEGRRRVRVVTGMPPTPFTSWSLAASGGESFEPQPYCARFEELAGYAPQFRAFARSIRTGHRPRGTAGDAAATHELLAMLKPVQARAAAR